MEYQFTLLMVSQTITTGTGGNRSIAPWSNTTGAITFPDASLSTITITDDDDRFQSGRYTASENGQTLTAPAVFEPNGTPVPAGTGITNFTGSVLRDMTQNPDGSWNEFIVIFPRTIVSGQLGTELGARHSVLVIPKPLPNGSFPTFDLSHSYKFQDTYSISVSNDAMPYRPLAAPSSVPCFASGSLIETPKGIRRIEDLRAGDLVLTADNGAQEIRWIGQTHVDAARLDLQPNLRPILIRAGALGCGLPARDLTVSPQHRVLVRSRIGRRLFDENEVMLAAKHLVGLPGIEVINPAEGVTYLHLLFDRHELVRSNGCLTESLFTGPQAMLAVGPAARREIQSLFPELIRPDHRPIGVRRFLTGAEARTLSERHLRNLSRRQLVETL